MNESEARPGVIDAPRVFVEPEAVMADAKLPQRRPLTSSLVLSAGLRVFYVIAALALFVLALELLKAGAGGLSPILNRLNAEGVTGLVGFGWLGSYLVMSGSPVAAIALTLFSGDVITDIEAFAMINGTRLGASFIVLFAGFVYYVMGRRDPDSIYIGVVALLTAITLWAPVIPIGALILHEGWFDGVRFGSPGAVVDLVDLTYGPLVSRAESVLPDLGLFVLGVPALLGAFYIFDRVLPNLDTPGPTFERFSRLARSRFAMFGFGSAVTLLTMSVSLSLTILIPLTMKGYLKRQHLVPYIMGANIATWIDTLFASLLLNTPRAFTIVFTEMVVGAAISLTVLLFLYGPYSRAILAIAHWVTAKKRSFVVFLAAIFAVPVVLLAV